MAAQSAKTAAAPETLGILRKGSLGEWGKLRIPKRAAFGLIASSMAGTDDLRDSWI